MTKLYDGDTFTHDGLQFRVKMLWDDYRGLPWEENDCHGPVSDWERREKAPGELILCSDRGSKRFYDFQAACKIARDVWGFKTKKEAAEAARKDFDYLRRFCDGQWSYVIVDVTLLDDDGDALEEYSECIGGIESDAEDYITEIAHELAGEIVAGLQKTLAA